jgi:predicted ester cyclase
MPELYNSVETMIHEFRGMDAADQRRAIPALVHRIIETVSASPAVAACAAHDAPIIDMTDPRWTAYLEGGA